MLPLIITSFCLILKYQKNEKKMKNKIKYSNIFLYFYPEKFYL